MDDEDILYCADYSFDFEDTLFVVTYPDNDEDML